MAAGVAETGRGMEMVGMAAGMAMRGGIGVGAE
jgi:hypothetical protein